MDNPVKRLWEKHEGTCEGCGKETLVITFGFNTLHGAGIKQVVRLCNACTFWSLGYMASCWDAELKIEHPDKERR